MKPERPVAVLSTFVVRRFLPEDQAAVRALVLAGLAEHFDRLDPCLNHDLDDIQSSYVAPGHHAILAAAGGWVIGFGVLLQLTEGAARIVRLSVAAASRRRGVGAALVRALVDEARHRHLTTVLVETNRDWKAAIALYQRCGFRAEHIEEEELHMRLVLP